MNRATQISLFVAMAIALTFVFQTLFHDWLLGALVGIPAAAAMSGATLFASSKRKARGPEAP